MTILPRGAPGPVRTHELVGTVALRFARFVMRFVGETPEVRFAIGEHYEPFRVSDRLSPDLEVRCSVGDVSPSSAPIAFAAGRTWDLRRFEDGGEEILFRYGPDHSVPYWRLTIAPSFDAVRLVQTRDGPGSVFHVVDSPLVEFLIARLAARTGGLHLHASMAVVDGQALVFVGHSGAGKSTMAAIAEQAGAVIPTDDRTLITLERESVVGWGTPWMGSLERKSPASGVVAGIFLLKQASANRVEAMEASSAVKEIFVRLVHPRLSSGEVTRTLDALEQLTLRVPVATLHFVPTRAAFELALRSARGSVAADH